MPRRSSTRASNIHLGHATSLLPVQNNPDSDNLALLRKQWRWAAFSQFFCTFSQLFSLNDVTVADIENDLIYQTNHIISRIMQKLLYTLSYDRKVSVDNWQIALRKQYMKRDPEANPLGPEPKDTRNSAKDEEEEPETLEVENADSSHQNEEEFEIERVKSVSEDPPASVEAAVEENVSQKDGMRSRQSSTAPNGFISDPKDVAHEIEEEKPIDWFDLPLLSKLASMHVLVEWQFQNPARLRTVMKSDDELASWRIEPIGYDSKRNAYWFIGGERLWIQRVPPKAPRPKALKRKRAPEEARESNAKQTNGTPVKRARITTAADSTPSLISPRHSRAAKDQAKLKLDIQARELAELNHQAAISSNKTRTTRQSTSHAQPAKPSASRPAGTRVSARLRGPQEEEEWQPIPDEWLNEGKQTKMRATKAAAAPKTGLESDDETISDLTELSEEAGEGSISIHANNSKKPNKAVKDSQIEGANEAEKVEVPTNFVEWETICVALQEWEHVAERFEKATHYSEKALYKTLVSDIVPFVTQELREIERKRELEEALQQRKRSSRLAIRESEKEEFRLAAKRQQEEDEKLSRTRRMEARQQKEETERLKREVAREQRRQEREAREESRKKLTAAQEAAKFEKFENAAKSAKSKSKSRTPSAQENRGSHINGKKKNGSHSGSRTPAGEDWELDCEICQRRGINLDDGTPMMSCGRCCKWQHIQCHDRADRDAGRPRKNWDSVDFICRSCRVAQQDRHRDYHSPASQQTSYYNTPQMQPYRSYPPATHSPVDSRAPQYMPYRDTTQQSFYVRPQNQQVSPQGVYQSSSSPHNSSTSARPTISFSHYQPAAHGFAPGPQKTQSDPYYPPSYNNSHQPYNHSHQQQYNQSSQQYRPAQPTSYKSQAQIPAWNITTPANAPGYPAAHNGSPMPSSSAYRSPALDHHQDMIPHGEPSQSSYARYSPPVPHYPSAQFKHHPASYQQPPLDR